MKTFLVFILSGGAAMAAAPKPVMVVSQSGVGAIQRCIEQNPIKNRIKCWLNQAQQLGEVRLEVVKSDQAVSPESFSVRPNKILALPSYFKTEGSNILVLVGKPGEEFVVGVQMDSNPKYMLKIKMPAQPVEWKLDLDQLQNPKNYDQSIVAWTR